ncbi:MAG: FKBP-type peptidyl-prolyl cis-trans isomerase [Chitinophagales bacterium]
MKKVIFVVVCLVVSGYFVSCVKSVNGNTTAPCNAVDPVQDSAQLIHFAADSITLTKDTTGVYFQILDSGSGVSPVNTSGLVVTYTGRLMDNTVFTADSNSNLKGLQLGQLIPGWQIGLPKIKKGGHIKLLIPSAFAYGCQGSGTAIPSNAPVYFDIYLIDVI